jgi:hypothetical protein
MNLARAILNEIREGDSISFPSRFSIETSVKRLRQNVKRSSLNTLFSEAPVGKITQANVVIYRYRPSLHNSFRPIFRGRFVAREGKAYLIGAFSLRPIVKSFLYFWFALLVAAVICSVAVGVSFSMEEGLGVIAGGAAILFSFLVGLVAAGVMAVIAYYLLRFQKSMSSTDRRYISDVIEGSLGIVHI